jgi:carotenoid cleavage dioxygenase-like enzyme
VLLSFQPSCMPLCFADRSRLWRKEDLNCCEWTGFVQVSKFDLHERRVCAHWSVAGGSPLCEGKMIPRPGGMDEDDGVFVQPAVAGDGRTFVAVLDAKNLKELARAYTPKPACMGFHSTFLPLVGQD